MLPLLTRKTQTQPLKLSTVSSPYPKRAKLSRNHYQDYGFRSICPLLGSTEGLVHISEIKNERIASVCDFYKEGDQIWVKCLGTDNRGKIRLSAKRVNQETGEDA